jgi:hypothetical protein
MAYLLRVRRNAFVEQLLGAMFLFKGSFPRNVDLFFTPGSVMSDPQTASLYADALVAHCAAYRDNPGVCKEMHVPFLQVS